MCNDEEKGFSLDIMGIQEYQQNRYPYLMVDRITEVIPGKSAKGYKNLSMGEWFFQCHYKNNPSMPGMLQLEAMDQIFTLTFLTLPEYKNQFVISLGVNNAKFMEMIVPGDRLEIETELLSLKRGVAKGKAVGRVNGKLACCMDISAGMPEIIGRYSPSGQA